MITVADYSNGSEGYTYTYYEVHVIHSFLWLSISKLMSDLIFYSKLQKRTLMSLSTISGRCHSEASCGNCRGTEKRGKASGNTTKFSMLSLIIESFLL